MELSLDQYLVMDPRVSPEDRVFGLVEEMPWLMCSLPASGIWPT